MPLNEELADLVSHLEQAGGMSSDSYDHGFDAGRQYAADRLAEILKLNSEPGA